MVGLAVPVHSPRQPLPPSLLRANCAPLRTHPHCGGVVFHGAVAPATLVLSCVEDWSCPVAQVGPVFLSCSSVCSLSPTGSQPSFAAILPFTPLLSPAWLRLHCSGDLLHFFLPPMIPPSCHSFLLLGGLLRGGLFSGLLWVLGRIPAGAQQHAAYSITGQATPPA